MTPKRLQPDARRNHILQAAITVAVRDGFIQLSRETAAAEAGISPGLITFYYLHTSLLRDAVMQAAVDQRLLGVLAEGIVTRHPVALMASVELQSAALSALVAATGSAVMNA
jgi:AcrR family transcriptional regulator